MYASFDLYSASSPKHHPRGSMSFHVLANQNTIRGKPVVPLGHIILILSQPVFSFALYCCVLSGEANNTNFVVFGRLDRGTNPRTTPKGEHANHCIADVCSNMSFKWIDFLSGFHVK